MIYLDNAATTKCFESSAEIFREYSVNDYFNPSALYKQAAESSVRIKNARENIKKALGAGDGGELYFVSGGTEGDITGRFCTRIKKGS